MTGSIMTKKWKILLMAGCGGCPSCVDKGVPIGVPIVEAGKLAVKGMASSNRVLTKCKYNENELYYDHLN
jgi:hypothetical protein